MEKILLQRLVVATSAIRQAGSELELRQALHNCTESLGFSSFTFSHNLRDSRELVLSPMMTNWTSDFTDEYRKRNWVEHDLLLATSVVWETGIVWSTPALVRKKLEPMERNFVDFLDEMQMRSGVIAMTSANGHFSALSFETSQAKMPSPPFLEAANVVVNAAMIRAEALNLNGSMVKASTVLSAQQIEILRWAAEGKSNTDIADITGHTKRTVTYHVSEILRKLGVATRSQAVALLAAGSI